MRMTDRCLEYLQEKTAEVQIIAESLPTSEVQELIDALQHFKDILDGTYQANTTE